VRRVVHGTTLEIVEKQPVRLLEMSGQPGLSRARQPAEKNELSALSGHKLRLATVVHLVAQTRLDSLAAWYLHRLRLSNC
jgi:hypothetical protein